MNKAVHLLLTSSAMTSANKLTPEDQLSNALSTLKTAILLGTIWRYQHLTSLAIDAGATDEDIDRIVSEALQILFESAEQRLTPHLLEDWG